MTQFRFIYLAYCFSILLALVFAVNGAFMLISEGAWLWLPTWIRAEAPKKLHGFRRLEGLAWLLAGSWGGYQTIKWLLEHSH
jgi:hypothetical protein